MTTKLPTGWIFAWYCPEGPCLADEGYSKHLMAILNPQQGSTGYRVANFDVKTEKLSYSTRTREDVEESVRGFFRAENAGTLTDGELADLSAKHEGIRQLAQQNRLRTDFRGLKAFLLAA